MSEEVFRALKERAAHQKSLVMMLTAPSYCCIHTLLPSHRTQLLLLGSQGKTAYKIPAAARLMLCLHSVTAPCPIGLCCCHCCCCRHDRVLLLVVLQTHCSTAATTVTVCDLIMPLAAWYARVVKSTLRHCTHSSYRPPAAAAITATPTAVTVHRRHRGYLSSASSTAPSTACTTATCSTSSANSSSSSSSSLCSSHLSSRSSAAVEYCCCLCWCERAGR
jgi:hypothetical protein